MASLWNVDPSEITRKQCADFSDKETVALIKAYARRRDVIEGSHGPGVTQSSKRAAWGDITKEVNAVSDTAVRTVKQIKSRHHNITSVFKKRKAAVRYPPTGGGPPPVRKPWFDAMEKATEGDSRIDGVGGNDPEIGSLGRAEG
ncbi:Phospholipid scramblase 2 [Aphelenchoides avenae]|nr:Phospholipid scramblase 2 [Aphelenchus avenae]